MSQLENSFRASNDLDAFVKHHDATVEESGQGVIRQAHADGQVRDEVYVYGSFLQSRMYQQGVTCSDCHEPHDLGLRAPGNDVCLQCHRADKYDVTQHHRHQQGSSGASCAECHGAWSCID